MGRRLDEATRAEVAENVGSVLGIVRKLFKDADPEMREELEAAGFLGLVEAAARIDRSISPDLMKYAYGYIVGYAHKCFDFLNDRKPRRLDDVGFGEAVDTTPLRAKYPRRWDAKASYGKARVGSRNVQAILDEKKVVEIFRLSFLGVSQSEIANVMGVDKTTIYKVINRKKWGHVQIPEEYAPPDRPVSVLDDQKVIEIFRLAHIKKSKAEIARVMRVHRSTVYGVLSREKWGHVVIPEEYLS